MTIKQTCPHCGACQSQRFGKTKAGTPRLRCRACKRTWTGEKVGRPTIGDRPLTAYEYLKRHREKVKLLDNIVEKIIEDEE